jgi:hypothetical protein
MCPKTFFGRNGVSRNRSLAVVAEADATLAARVPVAAAVDAAVGTCQHFFSCFEARSQCSEFKNIFAE